MGARSQPKLFFASIIIKTLALEALRSIVHQFGSSAGSFHVFGRGRIYSQWNMWSQQLRKVQPYYAVKCNPEKPLLQTLASLGAGFDCASGRELMEVAALGQSSPILYANPCKPARDIALAKALGSPTTVIDSVEEVDKLAGLGWSGGALVRLQVEDSGSLMPFSAKFGLGFSDVGKLAIHAKTKGLALEGVSFHVGSGCKDPKQYKNALEIACRSLVLLRSAGHEPKMVDVGGGFLSQRESFEKAARALRMGMGAALLPPEVRVVAEPGRFFAKPAMDLFVQVIGKKPALNGDGWRYTIDESLYGQFSSIPFDHFVPRWLRIPARSGEPMRKKVRGSLFGRTCDSLDLIAKAEQMEELEVGDWLWFPHMGAYTSVTASEFNGFPRPPMHGVESSIYLPEPEKVVVENEFSWPSGVSVVSAVKAPV